MSLENLISHVNKHTHFSDDETSIFHTYFHSKSLRKKEFLLEQGQICQFEGYVTKGCFSVFTTDQNGKEHTLYFAIKDWWISDIDSFTNQLPSFLSIQALEDSEVLLVDKKDKEQLYVQFPKVERLFRIMSQKNLVALQRRIIRNHSQTAEERYTIFVKNYPQIVQKITNLQMASYLGISHEFLSKIRSKLAKKS